MIIIFEIITDYLFKLSDQFVARIALTHPYELKIAEETLGYSDFAERQRRLTPSILDSFQYDDYDALIPLYDALCTSEGIVLMEKRPAGN